VPDELVPAREQRFTLRLRQNGLRGLIERRWRQLPEALEERAIAALQVVGIQQLLTGAERAGVIDQPQLPVAGPHDIAAVAILVPMSGLWHRASYASVTHILASGFIYPNTGQFEFTTAKSAYSYGQSMGYISLFDFAAAGEEYAVYMFPTWQDFLYDREPANVLLGLDRAVLGSALVPCLPDPDTNLLRINLVEAWSNAPIPIAAIKEAIVVLGYDYDAEFHYVDRAEIMSWAD